MVKFWFIMFGYQNSFLFEGRKVLCVCIEIFLSCSYQRVYIYIIVIDVCVILFQVIIQYSDNNFFVCDVFLLNRYYMEVQFGQGCGYFSILLVKKNKEVLVKL